MAFQNLLDGDCGGQNPLMKLGSHFSQDQAFRQDRSLPAQFSDADALVNNFLEEQFSQNLQSFSMNSLAQELRDIDRYARHPPVQAPNVAQLAPIETSSLWSEEFLRAEKHGSTLHRQDEILADFQPSDLQGAVADDAIYDGQPSFERAVTNPKSLTSPLDSVWSEHEGQRSVENISDEAWINAFMHNSQQASGTDLPLHESESKFQKFWQPPKEAAEQEAMGKFERPWLEGYGQEDNAWKMENRLESAWNAAESKGFLDSMKEVWEQYASARDATGDHWADDFGAFVDPYKTYTFDEENPMKEMENPMEEGLRKLEAQDIPSAVLCFEAAVQAEPDNAQAWEYLGTTQAKNEQDPQAIAALKKCLSLQPGNQTALLSLAISYTNESYQNSACEMLREWLVNHPKYRSIPPPPPKQFLASSLLDSEFHDEVQQYFLSAANKNPVGGIDAEVQGALGVLFNLSYDYDKAVDCFKAALQVKPNDYEMWNKLGATLANGNRSEEAVDAYYNALQLSPGFIRARYNLGITCMNLGATREAAEHLLTALNQQAKGTTSRGDIGGMSDSIWFTLRQVISQINDPALLPAVERRDLATLTTSFKIK